MDRPGIRRVPAVLAVLACAAAVASGCALIPMAPDGKDDRPPSAGGDAGQRSTPGETAPRSADPDDAQEQHSRRTAGEHGWEPGALETTTASGVTFSVPGDWRRYPDSDTSAGEEAVYLWQDGADRLAESIVFNTGGGGDPAEEIEAYLGFLQGLEGGQHLQADEEPTSASIPGAEDAARADYSYAVPDAEHDAHGAVVAFTAATGEVVLFIISGDGVEATEELSEQIIATVTVGAPPDGEV